MEVKNPIVTEITYGKNFSEELKTKIGTNEKKKKFLLDYPTIYIIQDQNKKQYTVYVGETTDIKRRTTEHLYEDPKSRKDWQNLAHTQNGRMFIIGHDHFNKSLTLDIENRLMLYLSSVDRIKHVNNRRTNAQNLYYTSDEMTTITSKIWYQLNRRDKVLFPAESIIRDSALFKASPFHKLTPEQINAERKIMAKIKAALARSDTGQLILVEGEAGSGKTVLLSKLFYELNADLLEQAQKSAPRGYLLVNHDQQLTVYTQIAKKLGLEQLNKDIVSKPTRFINRHSDQRPVDIVLVDEAHLLWTQGKQAYQGKNQLADLLRSAKVVIAVFDRNQVLTTEEYVSDQQLKQLESHARKTDSLIELHDQQRINADRETVKWIKNLALKSEISKIPDDKKDYKLMIGTNPNIVYQEIKRHNSEKEIAKSGLSRLLATFDWKYVDKKPPKDQDSWRVTVGDFSLPWNLQQKQTKKEKRENRGRSWAEQPQTINEVGSTYTIQGFDLNYAGVIIGPSVRYRQGRVVFDPTASQNKKATRNRTLNDGQKINVAEKLLRNELNVLLTRGVNGLLLYAVDSQLQEALQKAASPDHLLS